MSDHICTQVWDVIIEMHYRCTDMCIWARIYILCDDDVWMWICRSMVARNMIHMSKIAWNIIKIILSICMHLKVKIHLKSNKNMYAYKHNRYMGKMIWENDIQGYMIPRAWSLSNAHDMICVGEKRYAEMVLNMDIQHSMKRK